MAIKQTYADASLLLDIKPIPDRITSGDNVVVPFGPNYPDIELDQETLLAAVTDEYYHMADIYNQAAIELSRDIEKEAPIEKIVISPPDEYDYFPVNRKGINTLPCGTRPPYVQGLIPAIYNTMFGRQPELAGLLFWVNRAIELGIRIDLFKNSTYRDHVRYTQGLIPLLYNHVYGRQPEYAGLQFWNSLANGLGITVETLNRPDSTMDSWITQQLRAFLTDFILNAQVNVLSNTYKPNYETGGLFGALSIQYPNDPRTAANLCIEQMLTEFVAREEWVKTACSATDLIVSSIPYYANESCGVPPSLSLIADYTSMGSLGYDTANGSNVISYTGFASASKKGKAVSAGILEVTSGDLGIGQGTRDFDVALGTVALGWDLGYGNVATFTSFTLNQEQTSGKTFIDPIFEYSFDGVTWTTYTGTVNKTTQGSLINGTLSTGILARAVRVKGTATNSLWTVTNIDFNIGTTPKVADYPDASSFCNILYNTGTYTNYPKKLAGYCDFLNEFGIWNEDVNSVEFDKTYVVYFPTAGTYRFTGSVDNTAQYFMDGTEFLSINSNESFRQTFVSSLSVTAGRHSIRIKGTNTGGPGSIALEISKEIGAEYSSIFNTRFPKINRAQVDVYPAFLNQHGIWNENVNSTKFDKTFMVYFPANVNYTFNGTADNSFTYYVDTTQVLAGNTWGTIYNNTLPITSGWHEVRMFALNNPNGPGSAGLTITNNLGNVIFDSANPGVNTNLLCPMSPGVPPECPGGTKGATVNCVNDWHISDAIYGLCYEMAMTQYNPIERTYIEFTENGGLLLGYKGKHNDPWLELTEMSEEVAFALVNKTTDYAIIAAKANGLGSSSVPLYCGHLTNSYTYPGNLTKFPGGIDSDTKPGNRVNCDIPCEEYIQGMIPAIYNMAFGRQPEDAGLEYWYNRANELGITQQSFKMASEIPSAATAIHDLVYEMIRVDATNFIPAKWESYPQFLNDHGIWEQNREQAGFDHTFTVNFPASTNYTFIGTGDDTFNISVDGTSVLNGVDLNIVNTVVKSFSAGNHQVRLQATNLGGPGSIALVIKEGSNVIRSTYPTYPAFLNAHGIWETDINASSFDHYIDVEFPKTQTYNFTGTADDTFVYYVDDTVVLTGNSLATVYTNSMEITAGVHRVRVTAVNLGVVGLAALTIDDGVNTIFATDKQMYDAYKAPFVPNTIFATENLLNVFGPGFEDGGMLHILLKTYGGGTAATMTADMIINALVNKTSRWAQKAAKAPNLKATSIALHPGDLKTTPAGTIGEQINGQSCGQCSRYVQSLIPFLYNEIYGRQPEPEGLYFWAKYCHDQGITIERYAGNLNEDAEMAGKLETLIRLMVSGQEAHYDPQSGCGTGGLIGERLALGDTPAQAADYTVAEMMRTLKTKDREGALWAAAIHSYVGTNSEGALPLLFEGDTTDSTHTWTSSLPLYIGNLIDIPGGGRGAQEHGADEGYMCECALPDVEMLSAFFSSYNAGPEAVSLGGPDDAGVRFGLFQWAFSEETKRLPANNYTYTNDDGITVKAWKYVQAAEQLAAGGRIGILEDYINEHIKSKLPTVPTLTVPTIADLWKVLESNGIFNRTAQIETQMKHAQDILVLAQRTVQVFKDFDVTDIPQSIKATVMSVLGSYNMDVTRCIPMLTNAFRSADTSDALANPVGFITNLYQEKAQFTKYVSPDTFSKMQSFNGLQINMAKANLREMALSREMIAKEFELPGIPKLTEMSYEDFIKMDPLKNQDRYIQDRMAEINEGLGGFPLSRIELLDIGRNPIPSIEILDGFKDPDGRWPLRDDKGNLRFPGEPDFSRLSRSVSAETPIEKREMRAISVDTANGSWNEPNPAFNPKYPNNNVIETKSGTVIEIDDTPGYERVHLYHPTHTYMEIDKEGNFKIRTAKDRFEICDRNQKTYVRNDSDNTVGGNQSDYTKGNSTQKVDGNAEVIIGGNETEKISGTQKVNAAMILLNC